MLRKRYLKEQFKNIFDEFNNVVYQGEYEKLNYKSWKLINSWLKDDKWEWFEVSREWVRYFSDGIYADKEVIYIGPYDKNRIVPNPEQLELKDNSLGTWLCKVLNEGEMPTKENSISFNTSADYGYGKIADTFNQLNNTFTQLSDEWNTVSTHTYINTDNLTVNGMTAEEYIQSVSNINKNNDKKENNEMMKFDFGPVDSSVHMSLYGMAIKNASGTYVAYDAKTKQIMDVDILNFEGANKFIYKMPASLAQIAAGDVVIHARKPMFVQSVREDNRLCVMDIFDGEEKTIVPAKSPFGFDFVTKVVSLFDSIGNANASNPFGNILPWLLMSDSKSGDKDNLLPLMLMANGGNMDMSNPMLMWAMMGNRTNDPMMLALMMSNFNKPTHSCACGEHCSCDKAD